MSKLQPYTTYYPVQYDYVSQLPAGWQLLPNIAIFRERIERGFDNEELLSVTIGKGVIRQSDVDIKKDNSNEDKSKYKLIKVGDIAYNRMRMWQGALGYSDYQGITSPAYVVLKPRLEINQRFFHYMFRTAFYTNYSKRFSYGIVDDQLSLRYVDFKRMYSIVPPLETQNTIVQYLDRKTQQIQEFIAKKELLIELLKERFSSYVRVSVSNLGTDWERKKVKYTSKIFRGKFTHRPRNDQSLYDGDYPFIQTGDVARAGKYIKEYTQTLNHRGYKVTTEFPKGTVVMTIAANIGDVAILGFNACFPDSVIGFYPNKYLFNDFLFYSLKSKREDFLSTAVINTQMNLNVERVGVIEIDIPSFEKQKSIVKSILEFEDENNKIINKAKAEIEKAKEYQESLITQIVTGQLKVAEKVIANMEQNIELGMVAEPNSAYRSTNSRLSL